jgi:HEAT repeat protein
MKMHGKRFMTAAFLGLIGLMLASPVAVRGQAAAPAAEAEYAEQYEVARRALSSAQYTRAVDLFRAYRAAAPRAQHVDESLYWEAFALSRMEGTRYLREALAALEMQAREYPNASTSSDARELLARVRGELANRGDSESAEWVYRETAEQDQERRADETKLVALNALMQMDSEAAVPILRKLIQNTDENPELRAHALFILTQQDGENATDLLLDVARNDPDSEVREQAVFWLSQNDSPETVAVLRSILETPGDSELHEQAVFALSQMSDPSAAGILKEYAGSESADPDLRANAVFWLGQHPSAENASFLKALFASSSDEETREAVLFALSQMPGQGNGEWLMDIALDRSVDTDMRTQALFMASQAGDFATADLVSVYDGATDQELKEQALFILSQRKDRAAVDKLIAVVRTESDPEVRQNAIFWLGQSGDPRAAQVLLDILDE